MQPIEFILRYLDRVVLTWQWVQYPYSSQKLIQELRVALSLYLFLVYENFLPNDNM